MSIVASPAGGSALLITVEGLEEALALFASLKHEPLPHQREVIPAGQTVLIRFDRGAPVASEIGDQLAGRSFDLNPIAVEATHIHIPVVYDGLDCSEVAEMLGFSRDELVSRHSSAQYTVAFTGFAPGFAYLSGGDARIDVPRRPSPRTVIPEGAVAIAGRFTGIYPRESPGGWQLIGRTNTKMWDTLRDSPAILTPGMSVSFVAEHEQIRATPSPISHINVRTSDQINGESVSAFTIESLGHEAIIEDVGRPGMTELGVGQSGANDRRSFRRANRIVGNSPTAAAIEIIRGGISLTVNTPTVIGVTGADSRIDVDRIITPKHRRIADNLTREAAQDTTESDEFTFNGELGTPLAVQPGDHITIHPPSRGECNYLAVRGGIDAQATLGSLSTDQLSGLGPTPIRAGSTVYARPSATTHESTEHQLSDHHKYPAVGETALIDVHLGPRDDWFLPEAVESLFTSLFTVTPRANRVGIRLKSENPLRRSITRELLSEGTVRGSIQVPANGHPVLFMADHPITGGYPVIAVVANHHLDLLAQIPVGAYIQFMRT